MKIQKMLVQFGFALGCVILMAGCSPSPSDAEKGLSQQIDSESGGQIKLVSFKKTDGQKFEVNGIQGYKMDYEAEIEFEGNGEWLSGNVLEMRFGFSTVPPDMLRTGIEGGKTVHRGDHAKIEGVMNGEKKESGWKFEIGESHITSQMATSVPSAPLQAVQPTATKAADQATVDTDAKSAAIAAFKLKQQQQLSPPTVPRQMSDSEAANVCINNLRLIDTAINEWALETGKSISDIPTMADIKPYMHLNANGEIPSCPSGGIYTLHPVGSNPQVSCSIPGHALQETLTKTATLAEEARKEAGVVTEVPPSTIPGGTSNSLSSLKLVAIVFHLTPPLVIINNHTFAVGDEEEVTTKEGKLNIRVVNITSNSATVEANGQSIELKVSTP